jgi:hypothetical protein
MAESVDALRSGRSGRKSMGVRLSLWAPVEELF